LEKVCLICGEPFNLFYPNQKYCGSKCKAVAKKRQAQKKVIKYREKWGIISKEYRYKAIGEAYEEHGNLMNQHQLGKGTSSLGPHRNENFSEEKELIKKELKRLNLNS